MIDATALATQPACLADLAERINQEHHAAEASLNTGLEHALAAGRLLIEARRQVGHGQWLPWLERHFEGSCRTAQVYVRLAKRTTALRNAQRAAHLSFRQAAKLLARPKTARHKAYQNLAYWENRLHALSPKMAQWTRELHQPVCSLGVPELVKIIREINEVLNNYRLQELLEGRQLGLACRGLEKIFGTLSKGDRRVWRDCSLLSRIDEGDILDWAADVMDRDGEVTFDALRKAVMCGDVAVLETEPKDETQS